MWIKPGQFVGVDATMGGGDEGPVSDGLPNDALLLPTPGGDRDTVVEQCDFASLFQALHEEQVFHQFEIGEAA